MSPSKKKTRKFDPEPHESVFLFGEEYEVQPHPATPRFAHSFKGGKGTVFRVLKKRTKEIYGLKMFRPIYRNVQILHSHTRLKLVEAYEGLLAARRRVVEPGDPVLAQYPDLEYSVLMPWVEGNRWDELLLHGKQNKQLYNVATGVRLCTKFLTVMEGLEKSGLAHTDIAADNVIFRTQTPQTDTQLLDLEDLYTPNTPAPAKQNIGKTGYQHQSYEKHGKTLWCSEGDRYASAVLAAELLVMTDPRLAVQADDSGYFAGNCRDPESQTRFDAAHKYLQSLAPDFAKVFKDSWWEEKLESCPRIGDLRSAIGKVGVVPPEPTFDGVFWDEVPLKPGIARRHAAAAKPAPAQPKPPSSGAGFGWTIPESRPSTAASPAPGQPFGWTKPGQTPPARKPRGNQGKRSIVGRTFLAIAFAIFLLWLASRIIEAIK